MCLHELWHLAWRRRCCCWARIVDRLSDAAEEQDDFTTIKLADFGLAKMRTGEPETALQTVCGTPQYVAPEMLESADRRSRFGKDKYTASVDMWFVPHPAYAVARALPTCELDVP